MENQGQHKISTIWTDNDGEYFSKEWIKFCEDHGIRNEKIVPYNPQQNGISERKTRTLLDANRCMLQVVDLHNEFWQDKIIEMTTCLNQNVMVQKSLLYAIYLLQKMMIFSNLSEMAAT